MRGTRMGQTPPSYNPVLSRPGNLAPEFRSSPETFCLHKVSRGSLSVPVCGPFAVWRRSSPTFLLPACGEKVPAGG